MGRMKSLGYAYAEYLQEEITSEDSDELQGQMDVDQYFEDIIHGEVEIPKWFVEQWLVANPIFASEEFSAEEDYEVIMVNVNHSMERDGETFVFGDVMFGLPDNGRSRISSYGQGPDKPSARQSLIERAIEHLHRDERMSAKMQQQDFVYEAEDDAETFEADPEYDGLGANDLHITSKEMDKIYKDIRKEREYAIQNPKDGSKVPLSRRKGWELIKSDVITDSPPHLIIDALYEDKRGNSNTFYTIPFHFDISNHTSPYKINPNDKNSYRWIYDNFNFDPVNPRGYASLIISDGNEEGRIISSHRFKEMNAETFEADTAANFYRNCRRNGWSVLGRTMHYGCNVFGKVVGGGVVVANNLNFYDKGSRILRTAGTNNNFAPALELAEVSRELQPDSIDDWSRVAQVTNDRLSQNFSAETKSWRIQNRDSSGKFTKGFVEEIDIADFMEMEPESIPEISVETTYTTEQTVDFVNAMINDDDLPMRLMDSSFVNALQSHISSADVEMLQSLNDAANMAAFEALMGGSADNQQAASRAVFVTDMLMNYKWGQDYWASEWE